MQEWCEVKAHKPGNEDWENCKLVWSKDMNEDGDVLWTCLLVFYDLTMIEYGGFTPVSSFIVKIGNDYFMNTDQFAPVLESSISFEA